MKRTALRGCAIVGLLLALAGSAGAEALAPFQMVRSLQLVQDRIANGDHAALPMQRKLLEMADKRLRALSDAELAEPENFRAVLIYGMSGGNPTTLEVLMPRLMRVAEAAEQRPLGEDDEAAGESDEKEAGHASAHDSAPPADHEATNGGHEADPHGSAETKPRSAAGAKPAPNASQQLVLGVYNYLRGRPDDARRALAGLDPLGEEPELGAFLALVRGSIEARNNPKPALLLLDQARLLGTGTLVEEAALRRSIPLAVDLEDRARFIGLSEQYARRFLFSPYAAQWADSFVKGVLALRQGLALPALDSVTAGMDGERAQVIYLRIARQAAIEHDTALAGFASERAGDGITTPTEGDPRVKLYAALPEIASERSADALSSLDKIDPAALTPSDRALLDAARQVAARLTAPPEAASVSGSSQVSPAAEPVVVDGTAAPVSRHEPVKPQSAPLAEGEDGNAEVIATRKSLAEIDRLLGAAE